MTVWVRLKVGAAPVAERGPWDQHAQFLQVQLAQRQPASVTIAMAAWTTSIMFILLLARKWAKPHMGSVPQYGVKP